MTWAGTKTLQDSFHMLVPHSFVWCSTVLRGDGLQLKLGR